MALVAIRRGDRHGGTDPGVASQSDVCCCMRLCLSVSVCVGLCQCQCVPQLIVTGPSLFPSRQSLCLHGNFAFGFDSGFWFWLWFRLCLSSQRTPRHLPETRRGTTRPNSTRRPTLDLDSRRLPNTTSKCPSLLSIKPSPPPPHLDILTSSSIFDPFPLPWSVILLLLLFLNPSSRQTNSRCSPPPLPASPTPF